MAFCSNCGNEIKVGHKFCSVCGSQTYKPNSQPIKQPTDNAMPNRRVEVYQGEICKCPNCGELLKSFVSACPSCGYEIRNTKSTISIKEFEKRLFNIESQVMPQIQRKRSVMETIFGKNSIVEQEEKEAIKKFELQKEREKVSLILNYPIPNSKEDLLEFAFIAASNIDAKRGMNSELSKAWISKLEQVYQKAKIIINDKDDFDQISQLYNDVNERIKKKKIRIVLGILGGILAAVILLGLILNPIVTISIVVAVLVIAVVIYLLIKNNSKEQGGLH